MSRRPFRFGFSRAASLVWAFHNGGEVFTGAQLSCGISGLQIRTIAHVPPADDFDCIISMDQPRDCVNSMDLVTPVATRRDQRRVNARGVSSGVKNAARRCLCPRGNAASASVAACECRDDTPCEFVRCRGGDGHGGCGATGGERSVMCSGAGFGGALRGALSPACPPVSREQFPRGEQQHFPAAANENQESQSRSAFLQDVSVVARALVSCLPASLVPAARRKEGPTTMADTLFLDDWDDDVADLDPQDDYPVEGDRRERCSSLPRRGHRGLHRGLRRGPVFNEVEVLPQIREEIREEGSSCSWARDGTLFAETRAPPTTSSIYTGFLHLVPSSSASSASSASPVVAAVPVADRATL